ncbi:hypothetical protein AMJ87_02665 [candidate division WOR_3 bacterium SM23_60]|uniref:Permease n=1 Tax=candidate division WOR_3 bacterium SM23_60 TaxID=1703780 RepID=A0A0S8GNA1_UNCW3|nr:MAG: hypothetical protein AMJ87_02665 [candidate division WOR_3 bacterium SM23_60]
MKSLRHSAVKTAVSFSKTIPLIVGMILLISLISNIIPRSFYAMIFSKNPLLDSLIGSAIGSVSTGPPITSYIIGGELLKEGVSLIAVTAFMVAWVTVGVIQFPFESIMLTVKFALIRNATSFLFSIVVAIVTVLLLNNGW